MRPFHRRRRRESCFSSFPLIHNQRSYLLAFLAWSLISIYANEGGPAGEVSVLTVPETLQVSSKEVLLFKARARGVQIYKCRASKENPAQFEWAFVAPEADLFDAQGDKIGRHYAGPTWESNDGSRVVGVVKGSAPAEDGGAVPWLLLSAKKHSGDGIFSQVTSIQRLETKGGKAPSGGCAQADVGMELRVPYTAVYYFYVLKP